VPQSPSESSVPDMPSICVLGTFGPRHGRTTLSISKRNYRNISLNQGTAGFVVCKSLAKSSQRLAQFLSKGKMLSQVIF